MQTDSTRLEFIFHEALAKTSSQARAAYIDQACRDSRELREEVLSLLLAHEHADGFLTLPEHRQLSRKELSELKLDIDIAGASK